MSNKPVISNVGTIDNYPPCFQKIPSRNSVKQDMPTILNVLMTDDEGHNVVKSTDIMLANNPLSLMSYDEFSIYNLKKNGIDLKPILLNHDTRIGSDEEFELLDAYVEKHADKFFVNTKKD